MRGTEERRKKRRSAAPLQPNVNGWCSFAIGEEEEEEEEESRYSATSDLDERAIGSVLLHCSPDKERGSSDNGGGGDDECDNFVVVGAAGFAMAAARALIAVAGGNGANERMRTLPTD